MDDSHPIAEPAAGERLAARSVLLVGLILVLLAYDDYGVTWDETVQAEYGELVLAYFAGGGSDQRCNSFLDLRYYGPLVELTAAAIYRSFAWPRTTTRHLLIGLLAWLTLPAVLGYSRRLGGGYAAAAAALLVLPRFAGHAFANSKDLPLACAFAWAMYAGVRWLSSADRRWQPALWLGVSLGLTLAVRVAGGLMAVGCLGLTALLMGLAGVGGYRQHWQRRVVELVALLLLAWLLMVAAWPWALQQPLTHPLQAARLAADFHQQYPVLFEGKLLQSDALPRYYLFKYLLITTPPLLLLLAGAGAVALVLRVRREPRAPSVAAAAGLLSWLLVPLSAYLILHPDLYDGLRHFLFVLPAVAVLAGQGGAACAGWLSRRWGAPLGGAVLALVLGWQATTLIRLHPYQYTYFNNFAGGTARAWRSYDTDYWAMSYREAATWLNARAAAEGRPLRVLVGANAYSLPCFTTYASPALEVTASFDQVGNPGAIPPAYDYYVGLVRYGLAAAYHGSPVVCSLGRGGAVFAVIRARREAADGPVL